MNAVPQTSANLVGITGIARRLVQDGAMDEATARKQAEKMMSGELTLEDFASQLRQVRKMGPIAQLLEMLPGGMGQIFPRK